MSLRFRLIAITSLALLVIFALFTVYTLYVDRTEAERVEQEKAEMLACAVQAEIDRRFLVALTGVQVIAGDQKVQEIFASRDRDALREHLLPLYKEIQSQIPQFHFHLPDSTSFLRLHLPERYGDSLKEYRHTVNRANADQMLVIGIEEGIGGLGYRVVMPISYLGTHQGTVEMGGELGSYFLYSLKNTYGSDYFLYSRQSMINFLAATAPEDIYREAGEFGEIVPGGRPVFSKTEDSRFGLIFLPLADFNGKDIAYLKIITDRSGIMAGLASRQADMIVLLLGAVVITAGLIMLLLQSSLLKPLAEVKSVLRKLAALDFSARLPVKGNDEISEIALNLNHTAEMIDKAMTEMQAAHDQTIKILDSINALVYAVDIDTYEIVFINKYGRDIFGNTVGLTCWKALQKEQDGPCTFCYKDELIGFQNEEGKQLSWEHQSTFNNRHYEYRVGLIRWQEGRLVKLAIATDSTERKQHEARLEYLSLHDSLTGLHNKTYFDSEIRRLEGGREYPVTIIVADLDNLKAVNDSRGHSIGDHVLKTSAGILKKAIRKGDVLARVGGDEFFIIMPRSDLSAGENVMNRIDIEIEEYNHRCPDLNIGISMGLAVSTGPEEPLDDTCVRADRLMYRKKPGQKAV
jgi:diguanylate cyclase (GGDEF)-like protein